MAFSWLTIIRPMVRLASEIAPGAVGRAAFLLFCTPGRPRGLSPEQKATVARALARLDEARRETITTGEGYVQTYVFEAEPGTQARGNLLLLHGWTGRAAFMTAFVAPLRRLGYRVIAVDLPGHGESGGRLLNLFLATEAVSAILRVHGSFKVMVAHSFGGAVAATAVAGGIPAFAPVPVERLVLIASPNSLVRITDGFSAMIGLGRRATAALANRIHEVAGRPLETFVGAAYLKATRTPTLVIHSVDDREVDFSASRELAAAGPFVSHHALEGLGHRRVLHAPQVIKAITRYLAEEDAAPVLAAPRPLPALAGAPFTPSPSARARPWC